MPYASKKQQAWAHTESGKKALGGEEKVQEWDKATKQEGGFKRLREKIGKKK
jgi:hypothetical protein